MTKIDWIETNALTPNRRNARTHSKKQIGQIAASIKMFGFLVPILIDDLGSIIAGHGRHAAARDLGFKQVPVIAVGDLSPAKKRALALADNKIAENAGWDREILAAELPELAELLVMENIDVSITGFSAVEIDQIATDFEADTSDPLDEVDQSCYSQTRVAQLGDPWQLGSHRILCGDARERAAIDRLMDGEKASLAFLDPPYNVQVNDVVGRGRAQHDEFAMASGEMSQAEFVAFLAETLDAAAAASKNGAIHFVCMDWRHIGDLLTAGRKVYGQLLNLAVWVKSNAGQGSFYRSQHELVSIYRVGDGQHLNNIELGKHGRNRSNVWHYAGVNTFRVGRMEDLQSHPTVKPISLIADAIKDCSKRSDIVLDTFCGSGSTIMAAERTGRRAFALEIEPRFVDVAIRRWQAFTRKDAINLSTGLCFDESAERTKAATPASA